MKNVVIVGDRQRELLKASLILRPPRGDSSIEDSFEKNVAQHSESCEDAGEHNPFLPRHTQYLDSIHLVDESYYESCPRCLARQRLSGCIESPCPMLAAGRQKRSSAFFHRPRAMYCEATNSFHRSAAIHSSLCVSMTMF